MIYFFKQLLNYFPKVKGAVRKLYYTITSTNEDYRRVSFFCSLINKKKPVVFDIGCNDGHHSLFFYECLKSPSIYCFEPDPRPILRFRNHFKYIKNVFLYEGVVSNKEGQLEFYQSTGDDSKLRLPEGYDLSGSIKAPDKSLLNHEWLEFKTKIQVNSTTLDSFTSEKNIKLIDFIWMDVQGAEIEVFLGAKNILKNTRFIYTEVANLDQYKNQATLTEMTKKLSGFKILKQFDSDVLFYNTNFNVELTKKQKQLLNNL